MEGSEGAVEAIWDALAMGKKEAIRAAGSRYFPWTASHPGFGSVTHAILFGLIRIDVEEFEDAEEGEGAEESIATNYGELVVSSDLEAQNRLEMLQHALEFGASPYIIAPVTCNKYQRWTDSRGKKTNTISFAGKTVVECLLSAQRTIQALEDWEEEWEVEIERISKALTIIFNSDTSEDASNIPVNGNVVDMWASVLADDGAADVVISARLPDSSSTTFGEVRALRVILCQASPVLRAMLTGSMREGNLQKIVLDDCSIDAAKMFLELLYTGTLPSEDDLQVGTMLLAMTLAHRWQVQHVGAMLAVGLRKRLDQVNFESIFAVALQLQEPSLLPACKAFIACHAKVMQEKLAQCGDQGFQDPVVAVEVRRILRAWSGTATSEAPLKRRRVL